MRQVGAGIGAEARGKGINVVLGPMMFVPFLYLHGAISSDFQEPNASARRRKELGRVRFQSSLPGSFR